MESFFKRLQEVTELPGESSVEAEAADEQSRDELIEILAATRAELKEAQTRWQALRAESAATSEEYAAYKTKVQTWREQMRVARAQDRKTIELLRQTGGGSNEETPSGSAGTSGSHAPAAPSNTEEVYVKSLEDQVKQLKEAFRSASDERDVLKLELKRAKELHRSDLARLSHQDASHADGASSPVRSHGDGDAATVATVSTAEWRKTVLHVETLEEDIKGLKQTIRELERHNELLTEEARQSAEVAAALQSSHREEVEAAKRLVDGDRQVQYIRSLEAEVRMWKAEAQIAKSGFSTMLEADSASEAVGSSSARRSEVTDERIQALSLQLEQKEATLQEMRLQMADLSVESSLREESIDRILGDCHVLELRLQAAQAEVGALHRTKAQLTEAVETGQQELLDRRREAEELSDRLAHTKAQLAQLSKDYSATNEQLRLLKLDVARRMTSEHTAGAAATHSSPPAASLSAAGDPAMSSHDASSLSSSAQNTLRDLASLLQRNRTEHVQAVQLNVHRVWQQLTAQRHLSLSKSLRRWHVMVVLFVLLVILFSLYQGVAVMDEEMMSGGTMARRELETALATCRAELSRLTSK